MVVTEFERARHVSCTNPHLSLSSCHRNDRKLKDFLIIILEGKCLFLVEILPFWSTVYEEFLTVCYVGRDFAQKMDQAYGVR